jgi:ABC-type phosphate/phosphonate transport system substrate-binding protein
LKIYLKNISVLIFLIAVLLFPRTGTARIRIGVLAKSGAMVCLDRWSGLGEYLTDTLGEQVYILPLNFETIDQVILNDSIEFLLANPYFLVTARDKYHMRAIATLTGIWQKIPLQVFGGVIFTRRDSPVYQLSDIKGEGVMTVDYSSLGGCITAFQLLLENNIDPRRDPSSFVEGMTHENVVHVVARGLIAIGIVRTGVLERMVEKGLISLDNFRILHQVTDDFPLVHSTRLYPEWPMTALAHVSDKQVNALQKALFDLQASDPAARQAGIAGWKPAVSYESVRELLRIIQKKL